MSRGFVIAGTDTGIGKTVFAAGLVAAIGGTYWKPIQAGLDCATDSETVARLAQLPADRVVPEAYRLRIPASPHVAAAVEGIDVDRARLALPAASRPLIVELAGGLMVPLTDDLLQIDLLPGWGLPVVLVAPLRLGTINHSLLSLIALRARTIPIAGVAFVGAAKPEVEATIVRLGETRRLGRLPPLDPLTPATLAATFAHAFDVEDFR
jgi:dethiobiotin synthetase